jgi:hypothetical protein
MTIIGILAIFAFRKTNTPLLLAIICPTSNRARADIDSFIIAYFGLL